MAERDEVPRGRRSLVAQLRAVFPSGRLTILLGIASAASGFAEAGVLALIARAAFSLTTGFPIRHVELGPVALDVDLGDLLGFAFLLLVIKLVLDVVVGYTAAELSARTMVSRRNEAVSSFLRAEWPVQSLERDGFLQELATTHATRASNATMHATYGVAAFLSFLALFVSALVVSPLGALLVVVVAGGLFLIFRPLSRFGRRFSQQQRRANLDYVALVAETSTMTNEVHTFGVTENVVDRIRRNTSAVAGAYQRATFVTRLLPNLYQSTALFMVVGALTLLYRLELYGMGSLSVVVLLLVRGLLYTGNLQTAYHAIVELGPWAEELASRVELYRASTRRWGSSQPTAITSVAFEHVTFKYPEGAPALRDVSFHVGRGECVGIVGPSGAGKSTLVQLLLRLRLPDDGRFLVNGLPAADIAGDAWSRLVAYVPQESQLIEGTVLDNLRYFRDVPDEQLIEAAVVAQLDEEIRSWPDGYETLLAATGRTLSGGQRQRLCVARALAAHPAMLVLDEPTSALDVGSEALLQDALTRMKGAMTMFIVAHRMSTLATCDRIMVLGAGRIESFAPAAELMTSSEYFSSAAGLTQMGLVIDSSTAVLGGVEEQAPS